MTTNGLYLLADSTYLLCIIPLLLNLSLFDLMYNFYFYKNQFTLFMYIVILLSQHLSVS